MRRIRLTIEYDGSGYAGFQAQPGEATIQVALETAFDRLVTRGSRVQTAGRTDTGVHALAQVVAVDYEGRILPERMRSALNAVLPDDISVSDARACPDGFDPRRQASARTYEYRILNRRARSALLRGWVQHVGQALDTAAMNSAAGELVGTHDFAGFVVETEEAVTRRVTDCACWWEEDMVYVRISANAFAKRMVRRISGALIQVGLGRFSIDDFLALLNRNDHAPVAPSAPAAGLYLVGVEYEDRDDPFNSVGALSGALKEIDVN